MLPREKVVILDHPCVFCEFSKRRVGIGIRKEIIDMAFGECLPEAHNFFCAMAVLTEVFAGILVNGRTHDVYDAEFFTGGSDKEFRRCRNDYIIRLVRFAVPMFDTPHIDRPEPVKCFVYISDILKESEHALFESLLFPALGNEQQRIYDLARYVQPHLRTVYKAVSKEQHSAVAFQYRVVKIVYVHVQTGLPYSPDCIIQQIRTQFKCV